jgi:hypothetical protein
VLWDWIKEHPNSTAWTAVAVAGTLLLLAIVGPVIHL